MTITPCPIVIMGICGTGKSTIARALSERLGWIFQEGDSLHPIGNVEKMRCGFPLIDEDRVPWLRKCRSWLDSQTVRNHGAILTCSALKKIYRERLACGIPACFVYLKISRPAALERLGARTGHFMGSDMLDSQLATLEEPGAEENVITVSAEDTVEGIVENVIRALASQDNAQINNRLARL